MKPLSLFGSLLYFVPAYFAAIAGYLAFTVLAAEILGTADFGYWAVLVTVTTLIGQFSLLGVHRSGLREAASAGDAETMARLRRGVRAVLLIPVPIAAAATAAVVWFWRGPDVDGLATAGISGCLVLTAAYQKVSANFLRGLGHVRAATMVSGRSGGALVALVQTLCLATVAWLVPGWGLPGVLACTVAGYVLPLLWAWWLLHRSWASYTAASGTLQDLKSVVRRDWRFAVSQTGGFVNSNIELWIAAAVLPAAGTSIFAAAQRVSYLLLVPSTSLQIVFSPALARLAKLGEHQRLERLVRTASTAASAVTGALWLPMILAPSIVLLTVYEPGFDTAAAESALMLLATGYLLNSLSGMSATVLSMSRHEGDVAVINWCAVALRLVSGTVFALLWGPAGLAASSVLIATLHYAASWWIVRLRLSISTHATLRPSLALLKEVSG